ncbi:reverse transcriptase [Gossypium australe]|uniref:Reverse transcriptase n=1 Tax=Gossypium australe TaxID=47621 RepID=A0A5B6WJQ5_9ROSI|nr:reverse transcriptase [Gossypium australe]
MEDIARAYFQNLFTAGNTIINEHLLSGIDRYIFEEDNRKLIAPYTGEEIREALFKMGSTKAPGEDGFPAQFYQRCWNIVGNDVASFYLHLLNGDMEAIANRFRRVIDKCTDEGQSAFVPGRLISDNVLLAYEILHSLKQKKLGKNGFMAVKLDMSKAYDRVEWNFVGEILSRMGFAQKWIDSIMKCMSIVYYSAMGTLTRRSIEPVFIPNLWRGPIIPNETSNKRRALKRSGPQVSHLLFANDCILFGEATRMGVCVIKEILREYKKVEIHRRKIDNLWLVSFEAQMNWNDFYLKVEKRYSLRLFYKLYRHIQWPVFYYQNHYVMKWKWQKGYGKKGIHWCSWKNMCFLKENGVNLRYKRVTTNVRCPRCSSREEDSHHVFRQCPAISEIWQSINLS